jgi:hypothetical protein
MVGLPEGIVPWCKDLRRGIGNGYGAMAFTMSSYRCHGLDIARPTNGESIFVYVVVREEATANSRHSPGTPLSW